MSTTRRIAKIAGVLFIIATVSALAGTALAPTPTGTDWIARYSAQTAQTAAGMLLHLIGYAASAAIAVALYPVLKEKSAGLALGSVVFRALEATLYMVGLVCLLALLSLAQGLMSWLAADRAAFEAVGDALLSIHNRAGLLGVFAFCTGAGLYYTLFFRARLIPRWLSGWGIAAISLMLTACLLAFFSGNLITSYIPLAAPIFLQEMVLAAWLIAKGFNPAVAAQAWGSGSAVVPVTDPRPGS